MTSLFFFCLLTLLAIPTIFLCLEVMAAVFFRGKEAAWVDDSIHDSVEAITVAVLIPAHNEEEVIASSLDQVNQYLQGHDRLLVVADNCSDETAAIARNKNAEVIERHDENKLGKGYALDYGIQFLKCNPPDVVVIMDADVQVASSTIATISRLAFRSNRPVQARYLLNLPSQVHCKSSISAFAFLFKNSIRPAGLAHLGGGCLLTGTGMAFAWNMIAKAELASGNIVEDMQLGIDFAVAGATPLYCHEALVTSEMAPTENAARVQRTRWEHGHFLTLFAQTGRLFREAVKQRRFDLVLLGLEVSVPPLASLALILGAVCLATLFLHTLSLIPAGIAYGYCFLILLLILAILSGWYFFGRKILSFRQILAIPLYVWWKIPIYVRLIFRRETKWTRTARKDH